MSNTIQRTNQVNEEEVKTKNPAFTKQQLEDYVKELNQIKQYKEMIKNLEKKTNPVKKAVIEYMKNNQLKTTDINGFLITTKARSSKTIKPKALWEYMAKVFGKKEAGEKFWSMINITQTVAKKHVPDTALTDENIMEVETDEYNSVDIIKI